MGAVTLFRFSHFQNNVGECQFLSNEKHCIYSCYLLYNFIHVIGIVGECRTFYSPRPHSVGLSTI